MGRPLVGGFARVGEVEGFILWNVDGLSRGGFNLLDNLEGTIVGGVLVDGRDLHGCCISNINGHAAAHNRGCTVHAQ